MWQLPEGIVKQVRPHPDWHLTNSCHSEDPGAFLHQPESPLPPLTD